MANTTLTASIVAKAAVGNSRKRTRDGERRLPRLRGEFDKNVNGYEVGDTITIRKPTDFTVRNTITPPRRT
jgi:hypothetical protein